MEPKKQKPSASNSQRLDALVAALASNPNAYPNKLSESALVATAKKLLAEIDKLG